MPLDADTPGPPPPTCGNNISISGLTQTPKAKVSVEVVAKKSPSSGSEKADTESTSSWPLTTPRDSRAEAADRKTTKTDPAGSRWIGISVLPSLDSYTGAFAISP